MTDRLIKRIRNLHARAAHTDTPVEEADTALRVLVQTLNQHRPQLRYCYPKGTEVKLVPVRAVDKVEAAKLFRVVKAHRSGVLMEHQRVLETDICAAAIRKGYLPFKRYGYYLFVSVRAFEIRL